MIREMEGLKALSAAAASNRTAWDYYRGGMGKLGDFTTVTYPSIEVLCSGTDASHDITLFMIKTG